MANSTITARSTDPDTSHEAAVKATGRAPVIRDVVIRLVRELGPLTHDELIGQYRRLMILEPDTPRASDQGIRTRLSELCKSGLITIDSQEGLSNYGNRAKKWVAVELMPEVDPADPAWAMYLDDEAA